MRNVPCRLSLMRPVRGGCILSHDDALDDRGSTLRRIDADGDPGWASRCACDRARGRDDAYSPGETSITRSDANPAVSVGSPR